MIRTTHFTDKPMAAKGLTSYRYKGDYGWIMIGATSISDALNEASRSISSIIPSIDRLQVWDYEDESYQSARNNQC